MWYHDRAELDRISRVAVTSFFNDRGNPVVRLNASFWLECERDDTAFTIPVMATGNWEAWNAVAISSEYSDSDARFYDIGANVGYYTLAAASSGVPTLAFEPNPEVAELVLHSLELNRCTERATVFITALGDQEKTAKLYKHDKHSGADSLYGAGDDYVEVPVARLDSLGLPYDDKVKHVVKVDVEGFEREVWSGATELRGTKNNIWFIEWVPERHPREYLSDWLDEVLTTHDLLVVKHDGSLSPVGTGEALAMKFETIVFRKRH